VGGSSNSGRIEHDAKSCSHGLRREIGRESGPDDAAVAVRSRDATPDDADPRVIDQLLGAIDERHALAEIEWGDLLRVDSLDLQKVNIIRLAGARSLETEKNGLDIEARRLAVRSSLAARQLRQLPHLLLLLEDGGFLFRGVDGSNRLRGLGGALGCFRLFGGGLGGALGGALCWFRSFRRHLNQI